MQCPAHPDDETNALVLRRLALIVGLKDASLFEASVEAVYREGMLEVRLRRAPEPERKEIEIEKPEAR